MTTENNENDDGADDAGDGITAVENVVYALYSASTNTQGFNGDLKASAKEKFNARGTSQVNWEECTFSVWKLKRIVNFNSYWQTKGGFQIFEPTTGKLSQFLS